MILINFEMTRENSPKIMHIKFQIITFSRELKVIPKGAIFGQNMSQ